LANIRTGRFACEAVWKTSDMEQSPAKVVRCGRTASRVIPRAQHSESLPTGTGIVDNGLQPGVCVSHGSGATDAAHSLRAHSAKTMAIIWRSDPKIIRPYATRTQSNVGGIATAAVLAPQVNHPYGHQRVLHEPAPGSPPLQTRYNDFNENSVLGRHGCYLRLARRISPATSSVPSAATPPAIAIPTYPSFVMRSWMRVSRLCACKLLGSFSKRSELNFLASS